MLALQCNRCNPLVTLLALILTISAAGTTLAAGAPCSASAYRTFDFWVGKWEVTDGGGQLAGRNRISLEQEGCLLVERWNSAQNTTGMSMNFYEPLERQWRQVWVSPGTEIDISGGLVDGSMILEGSIVYLEDQRSRRFRGTWTPLSDGRVRQFFEEAAEDGEWQPWFEGFYRRVKE